MGEYQEQLRHVAEPASPSERDKAVSATIEDHEALWLADVLRDHAHYGDHDHDDESGIAVAYASYIDKKVRDEGQSYVNLYAHTHEAIETLVNAILENRANDGDHEDFPIGIYQRVEDEFAAAFIASEEGPDIGAPKVIELDGEETVVYDEDEARESYAMKKMAEAEAEHEAELDRKREQAFDEGRI